ncbi:MAG: N-acetylmuramoyl-L-alanine amidase [Phycisphaerae bacterium]|jgi:N-acetylmuramoyl-L-alanine amidase
MRKTVSLILLFVFVMLAAAGCQQPAKRTGTSSLLKDEQLVDVYYLAGKLGMSISQATYDKISFNDTVNTVTILPKQNQIYVNDNYIGPLGKTKKIDGLLNIRASAGDEIQSKLAKPVMEVPVPIPTPPQQPKTAWQLTGKTIIIDPGHGGKDPGAISYYEYEEKTVNLDVGLAIAELLRDKGHRVIMTRNSDVFIELEERAAIANRNRADVFISIHADSSATRSKNGFTLYVARSASSASIKLADSIDNCMARTSISSNGVRKADYRVLTHTRCPAVLVELGYLSNYWEAKQLKNVDMQKRLAQTIADGIANYLNRR